MKKVLALVLAVIMVCTMAMALTVGGDAYTPTEDPDKLVNINPGTIIAIEKSDLKDWGLELFEDNFAPEVKNDDGKVIGKNTLKVSFGKGTDLVASQGWVEVEKGVYQYQIALKENDSMELDEKSDLTFEKVTLRATGNTKDQVVVFDGKTDKDTDELLPGHADKLLFDVGYEVVEMALNADSELVLDGTTQKALFKNYMRGIIIKIAKGQSPSNSGNLVLSDDIDWILSIPVKVGQKFFVFNYEECGIEPDDKILENLDDVGDKLIGINPSSLTTETKVGEYNLLDWGKDDSLYAYNVRTGKFTRLNEKFEDGVLTFNVPAFSWIFSCEGTIVGATVETPTGTTTNPGTGANDVVGVAAALAVVALVSGAAISLKK